MKVDGRCHCGRVTYRAEVDPEKVILCNCADCQMLTGSAFRLNVVAPKEHFELLSGALASYTKTADSGTRRVHSFCSNCGTPVYATADSADPPSYSLRIGCLTQRASLPPKRRIWCKSGLDWSQNVSVVPGTEGQ